MQAKHHHEESGGELGGDRRCACVVVFGSDRRSGASATARRSHDVGVALREQEDAAGFQPERFAGIPLQQAISIGHDVKLSKARLRFVHDLPLQGKSANTLNFRARPEQGSNRTERVESSRLSRVVWMFDPAGIGFAPREHRQFSVRPNFSKHRMNEENVMRMPGGSEAQRSRIRDEENIPTQTKIPPQTKEEKYGIPFT